jgi:MFS superfamily sulfate permease-like transporter
LNVGILLYASITYGLFFGIPVVILAGIAVWVIVNLLRPVVLRFFFIPRSRMQAATSGRRNP